MLQYLFCMLTIITLVANGMEHGQDPQDIADFDRLNRAHIAVLGFPLPSNKTPTHSQPTNNSSSIACLHDIPILGHMTKKADDAKPHTDAQKIMISSIDKDGKPVTRTVILFKND